MSSEENPESNPYASLPPALREELEDAAITLANSLKDGSNATAVDIRDRIKPQVENWIRAHAAEFSASVIRHYRRMLVA